MPMNTQVNDLINKVTGVSKILEAGERNLYYS